MKSIIEIFKIFFLLHWKFFQTSWKIVHNYDFCVDLWLLILLQLILWTLLSNCHLRKLLRKSWWPFSFFSLSESSCAIYTNELYESCDFIAWVHFIGDILLIFVKLFVIDEVWVDWWFVFVSGDFNLFLSSICINHCIFTTSGRTLKYQNSFLLRFHEFHKFFKLFLVNCKFSNFFWSVFLSQV